MIVKIISGGCDIYPRGSYHQIESVHSRKIINKKDYIPKEYSIEKIWEGEYNYEVILLNKSFCDSCRNFFDLDHPFLFSSINQKEICIRCWERIHVTGDRDAYRKAVEKMVRDDIDNQQPDRYEQIGE